MSTDIYPSSVEVRRWIEQQPWGHKVGSKGRFPVAAIKAWDRAHPDRPYKASEAYHGTIGGYKHGCRCSRCTKAATDHETQRCRNLREELA